MSYQIFGFVNAALVLLSVYGICCQLATIWQRKSNRDVEHATDVLSLSQFQASFWAYFSFFVFGFSLPEFNHYLVWPRLIASIVIVLILWEIFQDRKTRLTKLVCLTATISLIAGSVSMLVFNQYLPTLQVMSSGLIVVVTVMLAQGYSHQIYVIFNRKDTGAIDIRMSLFILIKDVSTILFALAIELADAWPLMLLAVVSGITKVIIISQYWLLNHRQAYQS